MVQKTRAGSRSWIFSLQEMEAGEWTGSSKGFPGKGADFISVVSKLSYGFIITSILLICSDLLLFFSAESKKSTFSTCSTHQCWHPVSLHSVLHLYPAHCGIFRAPVQGHEYFVYHCDLISQPPHLYPEKKGIQNNPQKILFSPSKTLRLERNSGSRMKKASCTHLLIIEM